MTTKFEELGLTAEIIKALRENGFEVPFPIQQEAIPFILRGIDVIGQAHTGTGKTAAFCAPILAKIKRKGPVQAVILAPTRELQYKSLLKLKSLQGIRASELYPYTEAKVLVFSINS